MNLNIKKNIKWSIFLLVIIVLFANCFKENYIQLDQSKKIETSSFQSNAATVLYSYIINKETIFVEKDDSGVRNNYKLTFEDPEPINESTARAFLKIPALKMDLKSDIQKSKTAAKIESTKEERFLVLNKAPLLSSSQVELIPSILEELGKEQMILARIEYSITENKSFKDKSNLNVSLTVLVYNKKSQLVYASEKKKTVATYLPDDKMSVAYFMGDILTATFKNEVNIPVNKHCRPQVYQILEELWGEVIVDWKK